MKNKTIFVMKNIKFYILIVASVVLFSCNDGLKVWSDQTARIQYLGDTLQTKSFIFDNEDVTTDTIILTVQSIGYPSSEDRSFVIKQVMVEGSENAIEGTHYVALNSDAVKKYMVIKANETQAKVPIIINRDALDGVSCIAQFNLVENSDFSFGEMNNISRKIIMSNIYEQPSLWSRVARQFGKYSVVKHEFMHKVLAEKTIFVPDDNFILIIGSEATTSFFASLFQKHLDEYNLTHDELVDENKEKVSFP